MLTLFEPNTAISYLQIHDTIYKTANKLKLVGIKPHIFSLQLFKVLLFILRRPLLYALEFKDMLIFEIYIINKLLRSTLYVVDGCVLNVIDSVILRWVHIQPLYFTPYTLVVD